MELIKTRPLSVYSCLIPRSLLLKQDYDKYVFFESFWFLQNILSVEHMQVSISYP